MKIKRNATIVFTLLFAALMLTSCALLSPPEKDTDDLYSTTTDRQYLEIIAGLEDEINSLKASQEASEKYYKELIAALTKDETEKPDTPNTPETTLPNDTPTGAEPEENTYKYTVDGGKVTITKYLGSEEDLSIPSSIDGMAVVAIGERAFEGNKNIVSVTIPQSVKSIGWFAFYNCGALKEVKIPSSVSSIGYSVFDGCSSRLKLICPAGSYGEKFAKSYGMNYSNN